MSSSNTNTTNPDGLKIYGWIGYDFGARRQVYMTCAAKTKVEVARIAGYARPSMMQSLGETGNEAAIAAALARPREVLRGNRIAGADVFVTIEAADEAETPAALVLSGPVPEKNEALVFLAAGGHTRSNERAEAADYTVTLFNRGGGVEGQFAAETFAAVKAGIAWNVRAARRYVASAKIICEPVGGAERWIERSELSNLLGIEIDARTGALAWD